MSKDEVKSTEEKPIVRTSTGLRDAIFDEIDAIRNGTSNATRANAVAKLANGVMETVRVEMEVERHLRQTLPNSAESSVMNSGVKPLQLGS